MPTRPEVWLVGTIVYLIIHTLLILLIYHDSDFLEMIWKY